ncbi:MAG: helix-turn-helix domain-containing protein [Promethearchaeota archaeon]
MDGIIEKINCLLSKNNYETFSLDNFNEKKNKFCFDLLAKKKRLIFSVKLFSNIDNLNADLVNDIKSLSLLLKSKPLLIGLKNRYQKLENNAVYMRYGLPFISINTFEKIIENDEYPYILARRGGGIIFLDGQLMKLKRESESISRKELSEKLGVTKRTVCAYENDSMRPSESIALKIIDILHDNMILKRMNPFGWKIKFNFQESSISEEKDLNPFETHVHDVIKDIGMSTYWYSKGPIPFKFSIYSPSEKQINIYPIFSGIHKEQKKISEINLKCLKIFTNLFQKKSLLIITNDIKVSETIKKKFIPIVKIKDLEKVDNEDEFIELVKGTANNI